jgi:hypothetical protein
VAHLIPRNFKVSAAEAVVRLFIGHGWRIHGMLVKLYSDRDTRFTSAFWKEIAHLTGRMSPGTQLDWFMEIAIIVSDIDPMARIFVDKWTRQLREATEHMRCAQDGSFEQYAAHTRPPEIYTSADFGMLSSKVIASPGDCGTKWTLTNLIPMVESAWMEPRLRAANVRI